MSKDALSYLIVDDHADMRRLIREYLPLACGKVRECDEGSAAIASYQEQGADLVLMDISMPGMDGITATRELLRGDPMARIVILTQHNTPQIERAALEAGASAFLPKADLGRLPELLETLTP